MKAVYKGIVSAITAAILLSLCLVPTVFATEEPPRGGDSTIAAAIETVTAKETPTATPSEAREEETLQMDHSDNVELSSEAIKPAATPEQPDEGTAANTELTEGGIFIDLVTATSSEAAETVLPEPDAAATAKELLEWLQEHENSEGTLRLTDDIFLDDLIYIKNSTKKITIDTGEFSIVATGEVYFQRLGLTVRGLGGEQGVFRAAKGGALSIGYMSIEAEEGFAVFQEEGAGLAFTQCDLEESSVHYAETPFVWEWKPSLAVVKPGQTAADVLPETAEAYDVNRLGHMSREKVPVIWELAGHESSQEQRLRFSVVGSAPGFSHNNAPVCTVVYDDFPLTFLDVKSKKNTGGRGESYLFTGTFSFPKDRLPITITQDYSFDGKNWTVYEEREVEDLTAFGISFSAKAWDIQTFPDLFIRLSWNDGGTMYYSNVLRYARDNLEESEDHGGNRGGGTDIVDPPKPPEPDPEPEITPPEQPEPEITPPETSEPETIPPPVTSEPSPGQPGNSGADHESDGSKEGAAAPPAGSGGSHGEEPSHSITQKPDLSGGSSGSGAAPPLSAPKPASDPGLVSEPSEITAQISAAKDEWPEDTIPVTIPETLSAPDRAAAPLPSGESAEVQAEAPAPGAYLLPIAAGLAAVAASIGGAAFYLHPKVWKKLLGKLRNHIKR